MRKLVAVLMAALLAGFFLAAPVLAEQQVDETVYNDYPVRWLGYVFHPVGVAFDVALVKPLTVAVCVTPWLFGVTPGECWLGQVNIFGD